jgi:hypothetical protein
MVILAGTCDDQGAGAPAVSRAGHPQRPRVRRGGAPGGRDRVCADGTRVIYRAGRPGTENLQFSDRQTLSIGAAELGAMGKVLEEGLRADAEQREPGLVDVQACGLVAPMRQGVEGAVGVKQMATQSECAALQASLWGSLRREPVPGRRIRAGGR